MIFKKCKQNVKSGGGDTLSQVDKKDVKPKEYITIYRNSGKFYYVYDTDALIFNYLFDYKILEGLRCGFPDNSLNKIINILENSKISYQILDHSQITSKKEYKNLNDYVRISILAKKNAELKNRLDILIKVIKTSNPKTLEKVIESIEECLKL